MSDYLSQFMNDAMEKVNARPSNLDLRLHALSLQVAAIYREFHEMPTRNDTVCEDLLTAFRNIRRGISVDPCTGKRWGSNAAYCAMQGLA
jgi:hypothetical protein